MRRVFVESLAGTALAVLCSTAGAFQQEPQGVPRVLIDRKLQEKTIQLTGIDTRTVTYLDIAGLVRREPLSDYLALAPPSPADLVRRAVQVQSGGAPATSGPDGRPSTYVVSSSATAARPASLLELTDGERFSGTIAPPLEHGKPQKDTLRWAHPVLGVLEFKLDQVHRAQLNMPPQSGWNQPILPALPAAQDDAVIFANGDRIEGFVESIGATASQMVFGVGGDKGSVRTIELDVVREIVFANPPQPMPARSMLLWLRDGSVIACRGIQTNGMSELAVSAAIHDTESATSESPGLTPPTGLRLDDLLAAAFDNDGLVPLATLSPVRQGPEGDRRWAQPAVAIDSDRAVLGAADLQLPGPMSIEWELPAGATRFASEAELPRPMWTWGDCELVVSVLAKDGGETEVFRKHINADQPRAKFAVGLGDPASSRRLRVRIDPGNYGSVQDQLVLHRPLLLVGRSPG